MNFYFWLLLSFRTVSNKTSQVYLEFALLIQHLKVTDTSLQCGMRIVCIHSLYLSKTSDFSIYVLLKVPK